MPTALIAEDEPLLAQALHKALAQAWPELVIVATVGDGLAAVAQTLRYRPDIVFLDIRMPGQSGIDAAAELADQWNPDACGAAFPALVFVTAYEQYAVQAFEAHAVDYLVKPLQIERLQKTVARLRLLLEQRQAAGSSDRAPMQTQAIDQVMGQLRHLLGAAVPDIPSAAYLTVLQASVGNVIHMVPLDAVLLLEASDKYIRVVTEAREYLIRT
ncbi:MAG: response regulator transcription factor, partial [Burkholderiaceae bacterium]